MGKAVPIPLNCSLMVPRDDARRAVRASIECGSRVAAAKSPRSAHVLGAVNDTPRPSPYRSSAVGRCQTAGRGGRGHSSAIAWVRVAAHAREGSRRKAATNERRSARFAAARARPRSPESGRSAPSDPRHVAEAQGHNIGSAAMLPGRPSPVLRSSRPRVMQICLTPSRSARGASRCGIAGHFRVGGGLEVAVLGRPAGCASGCYADLSNSRWAVTDTEIPRGQTNA